LASLDVSLHLWLSGHHFLLGICGLNLTLLDSLLSLDNLVELLLSVPELAALSLNEQILRRGEIERELLVLLLVLGLGGLWTLLLLLLLGWLLLLLTHF